MGSQNGADRRPFNVFFFLCGCEIRVYPSLKNAVESVLKTKSLEATFALRQEERTKYLV